MHMKIIISRVTWRRFEVLIALIWPMDGRFIKYVVMETRKWVKPLSNDMNVGV